VEADRVLLADADRYLLSAYREALSEKRFEVATASDGLECLARLREFRPHLLVLEPTILWGGGDGVLSLMHEAADVPVVPVIVVTSGCDRGLLYRLARFRLHGYHLKPLKAKRLAERIHAILRNGQVEEVQRYATAHSQGVSACQSHERGPKL